MEYTLLDTIESESWTRNEKSGSIEYQSLPQGIIELSYFPPWLGLFYKSWLIVFEGALEFERLNKFCKDKEYILINTEPSETGFMKKLREFKNLWGGVNIEKIDKVLALENTHKAYCVYKAKKDIIRIFFSDEGRKQIARVGWYELSRTHYFSTSRREGLELAEDYRRSLGNV